jgi:NAD(P)-dependent dehydrogenase (short-subunit alcohol dehydrogenase family)
MVASYANPSPMEINVLTSIGCQRAGNLKQETLFVAEIVEAAGHIDVLIANLAADARFGLSTVDTDDPVWHTAFDVMGQPLHRLYPAVLPQMYQRRQGKIWDSQIAWLMISEGKR